MTTKIEYNTCETCSANGGRAGMLIGKKGLPHECQNCSETREMGKLVLHTHICKEHLKKLTE